VAAEQAGSDSLEPPLALVLSKLRARGVAVPAGPVEVVGYGDSVAQSEELLALIRAGRKRAGTSLLWGYETDKSPLPKVGDIQIVLDHRNEPSLIVRAVKVDVVAYADVTAEYAAIEDEGDGSLEYWREAHWAFFSRECKRIGRDPAENMLVVCNVFDVLAVLPQRP
jgi:uncharacterized protein YhfF